MQESSIIIVHLCDEVKDISYAWQEYAFHAFLCAMPCHARLIILGAFFQASRKVFLVGWPLLVAFYINWALNKELCI